MHLGSICHLCFFFFFVKFYCPSAWTVVLSSPTKKEEKMSHLDVEALLDAAANGADSSKDKKATSNGDSHTNGDRSERGDRSSRHDRDRSPRDSSRDRRRRGSRTPKSEADRTPRSDAGSSTHKSRRRSRSRDRDSRRSRRHRGGEGDYYRGARSRSRSPNRYYRPRDNRRDRDDDRRGSHRGRDDDRRRARRGSRSRDPSPPALTEDERDRRTVFVQQLAARLRTRELKEFFEKAGPVAEAQIVKDRVSNRSKG